MLAALESREAAFQSKNVADRTGPRASFEARLLKILPGAEIVGAKSDRLWNTVSALMPDAGHGRHRWVVKLDKLGFAVSTGSACASGKEAPSHVLAAMGYSAAQASRVLRFSAGWETRTEDWQALLGAIERVHREMQR
jgi:cysteine desulfurase